MEDHMLTKRSSGSILSGMLLEGSRLGLKSVGVAPLLYDSGVVLVRRLW